MTVNFKKYQGTGNDFIMIDNRHPLIRKNQTTLIARLCDRKFGIGADGLILLQENKSVDFEMVYFNSDGRESSMCGNGGRCLIKFAQDLGLIKNSCTFAAIDGLHEGHFLKDGTISLKMGDVKGIEKHDSASPYEQIKLPRGSAVNSLKNWKQMWPNNYILNTGSPHYVVLTNAVEKMDVVERAKKIRYSKKFAKEGINVNFVEKKGDNKLFVRTYERGVEDETLSCGTGVVASALAFGSQLHIKTRHPHSFQINVETPGGNLKVKFESAGSGFKNIYLIGPAEKVFEGEVEL